MKSSFPSRLAGLALAASCALYTGQVVAVEAASAKETGGSERGWQQECQRVKGLQPPDADLPAPQEAARLAECDAEKLYYQAKTDPRATQAAWGQVRACAVATHNSAVLMMLYANGFGVQFNRDLAERYACDADGYGFIASRRLIEAINGLELSAADAGSVFEICDYAEDARAVARCAGTRAAEADFRRGRVLDELAHHLAARQQGAFARLREAAHGYANAHGEEEEALQRPVVSGAIEAATAQDEMDAFLDDVRQCEGGRLPDEGAAEFARLDRALNQAYRSAMQAAQGSATEEHDELLRESLRNGERAWLKYRDAWLAFGKLRYPQVPAHAWKAWLSARRLAWIEGQDYANP